MSIDDDIVRAEVPAYIKDTLNLFQKEIQQGETDYFGMLTRLAVIIDIKARADIAEQIFKKLNEMTIKVSHDTISLDTRKLLELEKKYNMDR
jgi:hypothetical protein